MTWHISLDRALPYQAWIVIDCEQRPVTLPSTYAEAERLAGENIAGSFTQALKLGYRIVPVEVRRTGDLLSERDQP